MRNGCCQFWFEKQSKGRSLRGKTSIDVCARGGIVTACALVCARQRSPQFPLRPYNVERGRRDWVDGEVPHVDQVSLAGPSALATMAERTVDRRPALRTVALQTPPEASTRNSPTRAMGRACTTMERLGESDTPKRSNRILLLETGCK